jgi:hypothetical protein
MRQLAIGILLAALLSLGYRLLGTLTLDTDDTPPVPILDAPQALDPDNEIQLAKVPRDQPTPHPLTIALLPD